MIQLLWFGGDPPPEKEWPPMIASYSKIMTRRRCAMQYYYAYTLNLQKKVPSLPLTLGSLGHRLLEAKYRDGDWKLELEKYVKEEWCKMFEEQQAEYGDLPSEAERLLRGYDYFWKNDKWKVLGTEVSFLIRLTKNIGIVGIIDLIVEDSNGKIWVVDHKFVKTIPEDNYLMMELQTTLYYFATILKYGKSKVAGVILNYIKTKAPTIPKINKDGTLSRAKIDTDLPTLKEVIEKNNLNPDDYTDLIERSKVTSQQFYVRKRLDRPNNLLKIALKEAVATVNDCYSKRPLTRTIIKQCSWDCDYLPICFAELQGHDTNFLIKQQYQIKENQKVFKRKEE